MSETENNFQKMYFAIIAGLFAAFGSLFGKLFGFFDEEMVFNLRNYVVFIENNELLYARILRFISLTLMIFCNASVWTFYVKALQSSGSSLPATITCTATNYIASALLGRFLFNEISGLLWWTGSLFIVIGLGLIARGSSFKPKTQ